MAENSLFISNEYDATSETKLGVLPTRGEKRLIPVELDWDLSNSGKLSSELTPGEKRVAYEATTLARRTLTDYMTIKIPGRKGTSGEPYVFRFLINPKSLSIAKQTHDSQTMTRSGWQMGVWGEDTTDLHFSGTTAGQYFSEVGLTDRYEEYSLSYRNLLELVNLFENNGYYFEGEEVNSTVFAADFTRKRIKMHEDIVVQVGNFIWNGMFTNFTMDFTADTPYFNRFEFGFIAWKERYSSSSPWISPIRNKVYRGHSHELLENMRELKENKQKQSNQDASNPSSNNVSMYIGNNSKTSQSPTTTAPNTFFGVDPKEQLFKAVGSTVSGSVPPSLFS